MTLRTAQLATVGVLSAAVGVGGCGGSSLVLPKNIVARIGHMSITKAEYERSLSAVTVEDAHPGKTAGSIMALQLGELAKTLKESRLIVPVPPDYKACIARWRQVSTAAPKPSTASLEALCERDYEALQQEALAPLVITDWDLAEAAEKGIDPSESEVKRRLEENERRDFHSSVELHKFLSSSAATNLRFQTRVSMIREQLNEKAIPDHQKLSQQELTPRLEALTKEFESKWQARTICQTGYVVSYCKGYKKTPVPTETATPATTATTSTQPTVTAPPPPSSAPPKP